MMSIDLKGKTALIGGSSQGIGLGIAQALAQAGASCILIARDETRLQKALASLPQHGDASHQYVLADFSDTDAVRSQVERILQTRSVSILVNNTGGPAAGPILTAEPHAFRKAFEQHLVINHLLVQLVSESMKAQQYGRIINVISTSVKIPLKGLGVSNTIRGAVASWAKTMANELAPYGITVNNILPGATETARLESIIETKAQKSGKSIEEIRQEMLAEIPAGRFGQPEELGALACFLASPLAGYINGSSIPVDGGRTGSL